MSKRFNKKNSQKYVVVHRPHDDPEYFNADAPGHILVPASKPGTSTNGAKVAGKPKTLTGEGHGQKNEHVGESLLYGINFDDSEYDYTQHLKPIGTDPENSLFIPAKDVPAEKKNQIDNLFVEPRYLDSDKNQHSRPIVSARGPARQSYIDSQQNVAEELTGFRPDMNPALREVLEALDDEAYVVNSDRTLKKTEKQNDSQDAEDDEIFQELLRDGEAVDGEEFEDNLQEWDIDNLSSYEDEHYQKEMEALNNVENLEDLKNIDYQADVERFKKAQKEDNLSEGGLPSESCSEEREEREDDLGDLPSIKHRSKSKRGKSRQKMGTKSNLTGYSMSSSAIARTETMTVLDDHYDNVISGYENYQEEQEKLDEKHSKPFNMSEERSDFESLLDDFLDNYELGKGGREFHKKDKEVQNMKRAADEVSKGKLSQRRNRERNQKNGVGIVNGLSNLHI